MKLVYLQDYLIACAEHDDEGDPARVPDFLDQCMAHGDFDDEDAALGIDYIKVPASRLTHWENLYRRYVGLGPVEGSRNRREGRYVGWYRGHHRRGPEWDQGYYDRLQQARGGNHG